MIRRAVAVALTAGVLAIQASTAQPPVEQLVYSGVPEYQVSGVGPDAEGTKLNVDQANEYRVRIVRRGARYFWASRGDRELRRSESGIYIIFSCDAGMVKLITPAWDKLRAEARRSDPTDHFDYVEVMHQQLGVVVYWGRGTGDARAMGS